MAHMHGEKQHSDDVDNRDEGGLKTGHDHPIHISPPMGVHQLKILGVGHAQGEMQEVIHNEGEKNKAAHQYCAGREGGFDGCKNHVGYRAGIPIQAGDPNGRGYVEDENEEDVYDEQGKLQYDIIAILAYCKYCCIF